MRNFLYPRRVYGEILQTPYAENSPHRQNISSVPIVSGVQRIRHFGECRESPALVTDPLYTQIILHIQPIACNGEISAHQITSNHTPT